MRRPPVSRSLRLVRAAAAVAGLCGLVAATSAVPTGLYRVDALDPVPLGTPREVQVVLAAGSGSWPRAAREAIADRIRREWQTDRVYGAVNTGVGLWLEFPLITARIGQRVAVPVLDADRLDIRGRIELPPPEGPKRVVILIDASSSANVRTPFPDGRGGVEAVTVLEAERRALEHLFDQLPPGRVDVGVIAFGESTWPVVAPGSTREQAMQGIEQFRREMPRGDGRTDAVCALWTAYDWLEDTPRGVDREIVMLTDGDMPHSGRFTMCRYARNSKSRAACEARRNQTACPAKRKLSPSNGRSDLIQMSRFARRTKRKLRVSPLVFESDRAARPYRELAKRTGGRFVRVDSPQSIEVALPPLVSNHLRGVYARNLRSGAASGDLLAEDRKPARRLATARTRRQRHRGSRRIRARNPGPLPFPRLLRARLSRPLPGPGPRAQPRPRDPRRRPAQGHPRPDPARSIQAARDRCGHRSCSCGSG